MQTKRKKKSKEGEGGVQKCGRRVWEERETKEGEGQRRRRESAKVSSNLHVSKDGVDSVFLEFLATHTQLREDRQRGQDAAAEPGAFHRVLMLHTHTHTEKETSDM